jgi:hypothetical protein
MVFGRWRFGWVTRFKPRPNIRGRSLWWLGRGYRLDPTTLPAHSAAFALSLGFLTPMSMPSRPVLSAF